MPFLMAAGTSFALPVPKPTIFAPGSPTTTKAEKLIFLPPLTTFVTRLIETTCSFRFKELGSMRFSSALNGMRLKLQSRFARRVSQSLDTSVIQVTAPVEHDRFQALGLGPVRDQLADRLGPGHVAAARNAGRLLDRGSRNQGLALAVVDDLNVNIGHAAKNRQARTRVRSLDLAADTRMNPPANVVFGNLLDHLAPLAPAPVLPAFLRSDSPVYRTPLFLYGSGL